MSLLASPRTAVHLVTVLEDMPVQETADGIDELRARRAAGRRRRRQPGPPARARRRGSATRPSPASCPRDAVEADLRKAGVDVDRRRCVDGLLDEARDHAERRDARGRAARARRALGRADVRADPARRRRSTSAGSTSSPPSSARAGHGMTHPPTSRPRRVGPLASRSPATRPRSTSTRCSTTRAPSVIVCCGSGGVGKTTTSAALALRAAERGRKVVVLTIDPARRLAQSMGIEKLDNIPRPVPGVDVGRRVARRDDAGHEAHLRRGRRVPGQPREGRADPGNPFYVSAVQLLRRHAGVHGDGEARPAARRTPAAPAAGT